MHALATAIALASIALVPTTSLTSDTARASAVAAVTQSAANYKVSTKGPGKLSVGTAGKVTVAVKPGSGWHMNLDFPSSLAITSSDGLKVAQAKLKKKQAKVLDDNGLVFEVPVTARAAGEQTLSGKLKFAVCRDEACAPATEAIAVRIAVK